MATDVTLVLAGGVESCCTTVGRGWGWGLFRPGNGWGWVTGVTFAYVEIHLGSEIAYMHTHKAPPEFIVIHCLPILFIVTIIQQCW